MSQTKDRLQVSKFIKAKPERVFAAFTEPELMKKWFRPEVADPGPIEVDARVGGQFSVSMIVDGKMHTNFGTYKEIVPNKKLVMTHGWRGDNYVETLLTIEFEGKDGGTEITLTQTGFKDPKETKEHVEGWKSAFANLEKHL